MIYRHLRDQQQWTVPAALRAQAEADGDAVFVETLDGECLTYGAALDEAERVGAFLSGLGLAPGDSVAALLPNGLDFVRAWLGAAAAGLVLVPLNTALTGDFLAHQLRVSGATTALCHRDHHSALVDVLPQLPELRRVVTVGGPPGADAATAVGSDTGIGVVSFDRWRTADAADAQVDVHPRDIACVMFTSGTTGPSKGVLMPHAHCYLLGLGVVDNLGLTSADRYYVAMPMYHANALFMQLYATLIAGASAVLRPGFSASAWLSDIRDRQCTVTNLLGAMSQFVVDQPALPTDREHRLRAVLPAPNPAQHERAWRERFGIPEVVSAYGMTEANVPLYGRRGESRPGRAGYAYAPYFEVRLHDPDTDQPVPPGTLGEICVRGTVPHGFSAGYKGLPEQTVEAFRNFWFHTGDLGVMDETGCFAYVDRQKDCIRRRGENISSYEVEQALVKHPSLLEVAAFAVPADSDGSEDEVMIAAVASDPVVTEADVASYADAVLPRFARPRYVELVDALPKTPTQRVQKALLRQRGVGATTWDRERTPSIPSEVDR